MFSLYPKLIRQTSSRLPHFFSHAQVHTFFFYLALVSKPLTCGFNQRGAGFIESLPAADAHAERSTAVCLPVGKLTPSARLTAGSYRKVNSNLLPARLVNSHINLIPLLTTDKK